MSGSMCIALLRGINVGGRNRLAMSDLRTLATQLGWRNVRSYVQSGNLVFSAAPAPARLEGALERAIAERHGLAIPVIIRTAREWTEYVETNPFPEAAEREPALVMLALSKQPPRAGAVEELRARASPVEDVRDTGAALWIHYGGGAGRSRLSPGLLDRIVGSPVTTRNWRTVCELAEMAASAAQ